MTDGNSDTLKRHLSAEAGHDAGAAAACYAEDGWYEHVALGLRFEGRDAVEAQYASSYATFPDLAFEIEGEVLSGDIAVHWGRIRGTATGEFLGQMPTDRSVDDAMTAIYEIRNGVISSERVFLDLATMAAQAGWHLDEIRTALGLDTTSTP